MQSELEEAAILFGAAKDSVLTKAQAVDTLSALGYAIRDSEADTLLKSHVNPEELVSIASKLGGSKLTREELARLIHDLNPNSAGSISRGTLIYILKMSRHATDEEIEQFLNELNITEDQGMVQVDSLINSLMSVLN